jgi:folylpolyglutamate synthase/dihydropteroate synthase
MFADKDIEGVVRLIAPLTDHAYAGTTGSSRSASPERVAAALLDSGVGDVQTFPSIPEAVSTARSRAKEQDAILVTGSFYTVGRARPLFVGG